MHAEMELQARKVLRFADYLRASVNANRSLAIGSWHQYSLTAPYLRAVVRQRVFLKPERTTNFFFAAWQFGIYARALVTCSCTFFMTSPIMRDIAGLFSLRLFSFSLLEAQLTVFCLVLLRFINIHVAVFLKDTSVVRTSAAFHLPKIPRGSSVRRI